MNKQKLCDRLGRVLVRSRAALAPDLAAISLVDRGDGHGAIACLGWFVVIFSAVQTLSLPPVIVFLTRLTIEFDDEWIPHAKKHLISLCSVIPHVSFTGRTDTCRAPLIVGRMRRHSSQRLLGSRSTRERRAPGRLNTGFVSIGLEGSVASTEGAASLYLPRSR